jgi:2-oxoglutarate ferredoxin oxidoreductase subunit gamma
MSFRYCIRFAGAGTHGLIQAARILAEAAAVYNTLNATESCSYGPEARGSASRAEVIISDEAIDYPKPKEIDCLIALTQESYDKYLPDLTAEGTLVIDKNIKLNQDSGKITIYKIPFTEVIKAHPEMHSLVNIVALGFFAKICQSVPDSAIRQAIMARIPKKSEETYLAAFDLGFNYEMKEN